MFLQLLMIDIVCLSAAIMRVFFVIRIRRDCTSQCQCQCCGLHSHRCHFLGSKHSFTFTWQLSSFLPSFLPFWLFLFAFASVKTILLLLQYLPSINELIRGSYQFVGYRLYDRYAIWKRTLNERMITCTVLLIS